MEERSGASSSAGTSAPHRTAPHRTAPRKTRRPREKFPPRVTSLSLISARPSEPSKSARAASPPAADSRRGSLGRRSAFATTSRRLDCTRICRNRKAWETMQAATRSLVRSTSAFASAPGSSCPTRSFSTSLSPAARSTAYRPKRVATYYGQHTHAHPQPDPAQRPLRDHTDTSAHPLWRFFHDQQSLEVPDKRKDNSSAFHLPRSPPLPVSPGN